MKTDNQVLQEGYNLLFNNMDIVDAEKFIALIQRNRFDYTEWRKNLFENMTIHEIITEGKKFAVDFRNINGQTK